MDMESCKQHGLSRKRMKGHRKKTEEKEEKRKCEEEKPRWEWKRRLLKRGSWWWNGYGKLQAARPKPKIETKNLEGEKRNQKLCALRHKEKPTDTGRKRPSSSSMTFNSFSSLLRGKKERGSCLQTGSHHPFMVFPLSGPAVEPQLQQDEHFLIPWNHQRPTLATYQELKGGRKPNCSANKKRNRRRKLERSRRGKKGKRNRKKLKHGDFEKKRTKNKRL